ncbi:hypothetical protein GP486_006043 [Trichoglossum hirsutum]|uniref:Pre-rRNA-processing protein n=1 Tax=Trichoglossum hirsutum TaxID=265104 RepID=A0A9P8L838_9PEZI|nr:hypothetical protein GP486_006043 [Trichoglossum hirsutum]
MGASLAGSSGEALLLPPDGEVEEGSPEERTMAPKPKLKVGKAKPKAANFTDTSFKSKSIVLSQQSLSTSAPTATSQFSHHISLLPHHSSSHRRDSLAHLTSVIHALPTGSPLPQPLPAFLPKLLPLILDASAPVRSQLLILLEALPGEEIGAHTERILLFIQSAMTHLAADVRADSTGFLVWILNVAGDEAVSSPPGWVKTTKCFVALLGWDGGVETLGRAGKATLGQTGGDNKTMVKHLQALTQFLSVGLLTPPDTTRSGDIGDSEPTHYQNLISTNLLLPHPNTPQHLFPKTSDCYAYLNLFATVTTSLGMETSGAADDYEGRRRQFRPYIKGVERGLENAKKEGGLLGRVASAAQKTLEKGMAAGDGLEDDGDGDER